MSAISIKQLLESGVHFGHQTRTWNPKMKEYIFGERNGIHIIDLQQTIHFFRDAVDFVSELTASGKEVLFVGTKRQAQEAIEEEAIRCGMHYVTNRWLGGLLTNFETVKKSIKRYKELESMRENGFYDKLSKKEVSKLERERRKLDKNLRGIRNMGQLPGAVFIVDSHHELIAVKEANRLGIPIIAIVDTNCDPDVVDYVIPGNDDALRSVKLFTSTIAQAVLAGREVWDVRLEEQRREREKQAREESAARKAAEAARAKRAAERTAAKEAAEKAVAEKAAARQSEVAAADTPAPKAAKAAPLRKDAKEAVETPATVEQAEPAESSKEEAVAEKSPAEPAETEKAGADGANPEAAVPDEAAEAEPEEAAAEAEADAEAGSGAADKETTESPEEAEEARDSAKVQAD